MLNTYILHFFFTFNHYSINVNEIRAYWKTNNYVKGGFMMMILLILAIGFYLYKTGDLQRMTSNFTGNSNQSYQPEQAKSILDARLAKGEITVEEYKNLKQVL